MLGWIARTGVILPEAPVAVKQENETSWTAISLDTADRFLFIVLAIHRDKVQVIEGGKQ
jgi:hypothetical protein